jgi:ketosteroid isomerase-like protein
MTPDQNKEVVRRYAGAFSRGDLEGVVGCFSEDAVIYGVLGKGGLEAVRPIWEALISGLSMQLHIEELAAEGDVVAARYTETGSFSRPFREKEPTGQGYQVTAMEWFRLRDGRIVERWGARDSAAIARQIGIDSF